MRHNHPMPNHPISKYCQYELPDGSRVCRFKYHLQPTTTIDPDGRIHYRRRKAGDEMIVPHCLPLLRTFQCHINFEVANTSHIFQYLFKYIHKGIPSIICTIALLLKLLGPDHARYRVQDPNPDNTINEIDDYWDARYLSAGEATWRILGFHVTKKDPTVTSLPVHLPESRLNHQYLRTNDTASTLSLLNRYFQRPVGYFTNTSGIHRTFSDLTYAEYFTLFRLNRFDIQNTTNPRYFNESPPNSSTPQPRMHVVQRDVMHPHLSRIVLRVH